MRYIKCILLVVLYSFLPMITRIIGTGFLTKFTDDYATLYQNAAYEYGLQSEELQTVVDYGGVYFTWIALFIIVLLFINGIKKDNVFKKSNKCVLFFSIGFALSSIFTFISNSIIDNTVGLDISENKVIWLICYVLQALLLVLVDELVFRYGCLKLLDKDNKVVQFIFPLVLYLIVQDNIFEILVGIILYSISFVIYKRTDNLALSLLFNLGLSISTLVSGFVSNNVVIIIMFIVSIIVVLVDSIRLVKWKK